MRWPAGSGSSSSSRGARDWFLSWHPPPPQIRFPPPDPLHTFRILWASVIVPCDGVSMIAVDMKPLGTCFGTLSFNSETKTSCGGAALHCIGYLGGLGCKIRPYKVPAGLLGEKGG